MDVVFNVTGPVFGIIAAGVLAGRWGLLGQASTEALNRFVYFIALPPLLFLGTALRPLGEIFNLPFIGAFLGAMLVVFALGIAAGRGLHRAPWPVAVMQGLNASFSNTGYMGIPLFLAAFGPDRLAPAILATIIMSAVMVGLGVALIELARHAGHGLALALRQVLAALARNPLILAPAAGLLVSALSLPVPRPLQTFCELLGAAAGPCALFAIGLFLAGRRFVAAWGEVGPIALLKLVVHPALTLLFLTWWFPLEPAWHAAAVVLAALPTGALTFVVAQRYEVYVERTSATILVTTLISLLTLSVLLALYAPRS